MPGGKGHVIVGMPIFSQENMWEELFVFFESIDVFEYLSTLRDSKASSFTKIILNVDNYECSWHIQKNNTKKQWQTITKNKLIYSGE